MEEKFLKVIEMFKERTKKDCYKIDIVEGEPSILDDKIGGKSYLPIGEEYPKDKNGEPLALLLQVNLKNVDLEGYPKKGILEIYTDKDVDYPCQYAVKYFEEGLEYQTDLPNVDLSNYIVKNSLKINLTKDVCYMAINDYRFVKIMCEIVNQVYGTTLNTYGQLDDYFKEFAWYDKLRDGYTNHPITLGGYPDFTQQDPRLNIKDNKDECLFKLDSWGNFSTFAIGDSGILSVLISKEDIENCDFEKGLVSWDCY